MRVTIDSNVILSAILFKSKNSSNVLKKIQCDHRFVMNNFVLCETEWTTEVKFHDLRWTIRQFLEHLKYEYYAVDKSQIKEKHFDIRDKSDRKILGAAVLSNCDILVTGDKDFFAIEHDGIEILTPRQFLEKY